ncbi:MAG: hypothetical protein KDE51_14280, partial [Anaerolineales bacterium]|nr:hypothetical protein [Anaerolineales bacterium]
MKKLELVLFGQPKIMLDGQPVEQLTSSKARALLFYLVVTGQTHARGSIATMLWPDVTGERARRNLRGEIFKLRQVMPTFIQATRRTVRFNQEAAHVVDTAVFEQCLHKQQPSIADLETAVACYQGEFLDQFDAGDVDAFDRWMSNTRELFHNQAIEAMFNLAIQYAEMGEYAAGIEQLNSLLVFDPWRDDAHRQLMLLFALTDRRADALRQYEICCAVLEEELKIKPAAETTEIYQQILEGEIHAESLIRFDHVKPEPKIAPPIPFMAPTKTNHFVGREAQLTAVAARLLGQTGQTGTALVGMGGVGKTTVAAYIAHLVREKFTDGVLWGNLANYEPRRLLEQWAEALGYDFSGLNRLDLLVETLRPILAAKNILIIVDDVRSVSRLRPVLDCVGERPLLITTRSWELARLLEMETIALETLTGTEGQALLANILGATRVAAEPEAAEEICTLLDNLPLALEITAQRLKSQTRRTLSEMAARLRDMAARLAELELVDQAVRTSFEVSWLTLSDDLKRMFVRVAVFSGRSFTPAAMAYISELDSYTAEDKLFALADLSLLSFEADKRYYQHALLADFAREKLAAAPWRLEPYQRMARYFYEFAQENQQHYERLRPEWENITAAIGIAAEQGLWRLVLDYGAVLTEPWFRRGRYAEAIQGYQHAQRAALQLEDEPTFAEINYQLGRVHLHRGDYGQARPLL